MYSDHIGPVILSYPCPDPAKPLLPNRAPSYLHRPVGRQGGAFGVLHLIRAVFVSMGVEHDSFPQQLLRKGWGLTSPFLFCMGR